MNLDDTRPLTAPECLPGSGPTATLDPQVRGFVAAVRSRLHDLTVEERDELTGGLEADLGDLVAEQGVGVLPDPEAYARELRVAAGFGAEARARRGPWRSALTTLLDRAGGRWQAAASELPGRPWEFLVTLRPVWWVARAWLALQLVDLVAGGGSRGFGLAPVPSLLGWGPPLLVVAVVLSVQLGRGRLLRRAARSPGGRVSLLLLNVVGVAVLPVVLGSLVTPAKVATWYDQGAASATAAPGTLNLGGRPVGNIYPYDAQGRPLVGVQLVDQDGRRLPVGPSFFDEQTGSASTSAPWRNGRTELYSTFPLPERRSDPDTGVVRGEARLQSPPFASLPAVSLAGVAPTRTLTPRERRALQRAERAERARAREDGRAGDR